MQNANSHYIYLLGTAAEFSYFIDGFHFFLQVTLKSIT